MDPGRLTTARVSSAFPTLALEENVQNAIRPSPDRIVPTIAASVVVLVHLIGNPHYGFFRDELYFIICGFHPAWGYVDQPPVVPLLAAATQLFGHSLFLLRAVPALFAGAGVYVTCLLVAEFGGGVFAQAFAALIFLFTSVLMSFGMKVSTDEVGLWTWPLLALLVVRITRGADPRLWLLFGAVAGFTLESKYIVGFLLAAMVVGLLLTLQSRVLASPWCAAGCGVAILIALPNLLWQWGHGFPMLELLQAGQHGKNLIASPLLYLAQEILITNMFLWPVWVIGAIWLLRTPAFRFLGYAFVLLIAEMMVFHGKHYYPANVYPVVIAAGAVQIEAWTSRRIAWRLLLPAYATAVGVALIPFSLPVLSEQQFVVYQARLGDVLHIPRSAIATEPNRESSLLPSDWADMHGWPEMADAVKRVYQSLPPNERFRAVVLAENYGGASAIAFFTPEIPVISVHNEFWLWGPMGFYGDPTVQIGGSCFASEHLFASRTVVATFNSRWGIGAEQNLPIAICRGARAPLSDVWPKSKAYI
jgi:hypothetical protein